MSARILPLALPLRAWNPADTNPTVPGWYIVRRIDDEEFGVRARAWGGPSPGLSQWWMPLPDGWLSGEDGIYEWLDGPAAPLGPDTGSPLNEAREIEARFKCHSEVRDA